MLSLFGQGQQTFSLEKVTDALTSYASWMVDFFQYSPFPDLISHSDWHVVLLALFIGLVLLFFIFRKGTEPRRWRVRQSNIELRRIQKIKPRSRIIPELQRMDPFLFEELLLTAFEKNGHKIRRNKRYTGDGGIDGIVWIKRRKYLVQAKRYKGYIRKTHVDEFDRICRKRRAKGLFIHTGKAGAGAQASQSRRVRLISDDELLGILSPRKQ